MGSARHGFSLKKNPTSPDLDYARAHKAAAQRLFYVTVKWEGGWRVISCTCHASPAPEVPRVAF
jgi:hypothetical protein